MEKLWKRLVIMLLVLLLMLETAFAGSDSSTVENPTLTAWCERFNAVTLSALVEEQGMIDGILTSGKIEYNRYIRRRTTDGRSVVDGGTSSTNGTFLLEMSAGLTDESLWAITFTYTEDTDDQVVMKNTVNMILCFDSINQDFTDAQGQDLLKNIVIELLTAENSIAIQYGDFVFVRKQVYDPNDQTHKDKYIIATDSLEFYDGFYKGTVENYYQILPTTREIIGQ